MAKKYIKSYSNYVLKEKHQQTNSGTIYERDITTIGGRDQFAKGQVPIYRTGNFVITTNNVNNEYRKTVENDWRRNDEGEVWTLNTLKHYKKDEKSSYDKKIVIKKDYFDLRDYAYYGSCSELMRVSIDDILKNYPGELFIPYETLYVDKSNSENVQYTEEAAISQFGVNGYTIERRGVKGYYTSMENRKTRVTTDVCGNEITVNSVSLIDELTDEESEELKLGVPYTREFKYLTDKYGNILKDNNGSLIGIKSLSLIDNPFGINIHNKFVPDGENPLRYFAEGGNSNYVGYLKLDNYDNLSIDGEWKFDKDHTYAVTINDILFDGLGESIDENESFDAQGGNCSSVQQGICTANMIIDIISHSTVNRTADCTIDCIEPGKYLGRLNLCFRQIDYSFRTTPGLQRNELTGEPIEVCCDGSLKFNEGKDEKEALIDSYSTSDCIYNLTIYMFMGNNGEIKYLVEDLDYGGNINFEYENNTSIVGDCIDADKKIVANADFNGTFKWENFVARIRPNNEIIDNYFNNLDLFERVLLNRESDPLYTANFELINDDDYGMYTYTKQFTFPTTYGGYNLGSNSQIFSEYVRSLSEVGEYYDEMFTDNLWRSMTHEAIKNFDWTYTRHYTPGDEEPYMEAGTKIQKVIRLYGREFDEVKSYIDAIDDLNTITYDNVNNAPDYFFTDKLEEEGWDVKLIHPLELSEFVNGHDNVPINIHSLFVKKYNDEGDEICTEEAEQLNYFYDSPISEMFDVGSSANNCDGSCSDSFSIKLESHKSDKRNKITIQRVFNQKDVSVVPYSCSKITTIKNTSYSQQHPDSVDTVNEVGFEYDDSQFSPCVEGGDGKTYAINSTTTSGENVRDGYHNDCGDIIRIYCDENEYSSSDVNNEFMKRLIINSEAIWRHKGTIEGMEMLLSLFGLRSKNKVYTDDRYFVMQKGLNDGDEHSYFDTNIKDIYACDDLSFSVDVTAEKSKCLSLTDEGKKYYKNYSNNLYNIYDYDIKEYTLFTTREEDEWVPSKDMYKLDWVNTTKMVSYSNADENYEPYKGLPVSYREIKDLNGNKKRFIYPHFDSYVRYDGNPYYQMDGGWMQKKPFMFDEKNNIVIENVESENRKNKALFTETVKNIKCVNTLQDLLSNPSLADNSGDICQVSDLSGKYAIIDGYLYPLLTELTDNEGTGYTFFTAQIYNGTLSVGNALFTDYVVISNPYFTNNKQKIYLNDDFYSDREIKIYLLKNDDGEYDIDVYSKETSISTFTVFENGKYMKGDNYTNYFRINNVDYYNELSVLGWQQLKNDEYEYYRMNLLTDYREGNNPHYGHMKYDNGHKYLTYFQKIFKYVGDNDLFDYRQYDEDDVDYVGEANNFGFKNLIDDDECEPDYDKYLREDNKCHFFGRIMSKLNEDCNDDRNGLSCFSKRESANQAKYDKIDDECVERADSYKLTDIFRKDIVIDNEGTPRIENLRYGQVYDVIGESGEYDEEKIDNVTDQIVNTKRMEIEFFIKNGKEYSKEWLEEVKYIDSVILPYLTQMIPSNTIWRIKYTTRDKVAWCAEEKEDCINDYFYTNINEIECNPNKTQFKVELTSERK